MLKYTLLFDSVATASAVAFSLRGDWDGCNAVTLDCVNDEALNWALQLAGSEPTNYCYSKETCPVYDSDSSRFSANYSVHRTQEQEHIIFLVLKTVVLLQHRTGLAVFGSSMMTITGISVLVNHCEPLQVLLKNNHLLQNLVGGIILLVFLGFFLSFTMLYSYFTYEYKYDLELKYLGGVTPKIINKILLTTGLSFLIILGLSFLIFWLSLSRTPLPS